MHDRSGQPAPIFGSIQNVGITVSFVVLLDSVNADILSIARPEDRAPLEGGPD